MTAWLFELAGGAIGDFENTCLPKEQRDAAFNVAALHQWDLDVDDPRCISSAEDVSVYSSLDFTHGLNELQWLHDTMSPVTTGGPFPSVRVPLGHLIFNQALPVACLQFLGRHEPAARTQACYGNNFSRLSEIKKKYDPSNVFRNTFWPLDKNGDVVEPQTHEPPSP